MSEKAKDFFMGFGIGLGVCGSIAAILLGVLWL